MNAFKEASIQSGKSFKSPVMETYRLSCIPSSFNIPQIKKLFIEEDQKLVRDPISLANSVSKSIMEEKIATVTFVEEPSFAGSVSNRDPCSFKTWGEIDPSCCTDARQIHIDSSFEGFTPLNHVDVNLETVDIVACTGIYGRPFGSWQHQQGTMWLRDFLPRSLDNCRVLIWGKHSQFHRGLNPSHADVNHYRDSLIEDLKVLRERKTDKHRPLILMGHSFGGILIKAAFVKLCQDETTRALRDIIGGLVFFATPHEGIYNQPWLEIWGNDPSEKLIRDLGPGSTLLRELRQNLAKYLQNELVLTLFELKESATVRKTDDKPDKKGPPALMIDEKAACIHHPKETAIPFHGDHSKIAKLSCAEGCIYWNIKSYLLEMVIQARVIVAHRTTRKQALDVLCDIKTYIAYLLQNASSSLLMAEFTEFDNICSVFRDTEELWLGPRIPTPGVLNALEAIGSLRDLFRDNISRAASTNARFKRKLLGSFDDDCWRTTEAELKLSEADLTQLANVAIPSIIMLKQSLCAVFHTHDPSFLQTFMQSDEAKYLGLDFVARRRNLLDKVDIEPLQPLQGVLENVKYDSGLTTATWYPIGGSEQDSVLCEYRSYSDSDIEERERKKTASQQLATMLKDVSFKPTTKELPGDIFKPTMSIFEFEGYFDDEEQKRLTFIYNIPKSMDSPSIGLPKYSGTLDKWLTGDRIPLLEERFTIAYRLCHSVYNQHLCGWVHKSIRPNNIVIMPDTPRASQHLQVGETSYTPYLKGFEHARAAAAISELQALPDPENDIYRHPNRRGREKFRFNFHPIHDIYAVGAVLVEIGLHKPLVDVIAEMRKKSSPGIEEDWIVRVAREKVPRLLGTRYAACALKCLKGHAALGVDKKERDDIKLAFAFRKQVVDELKRMAVSCGYLM